MAAAEIKQHTALGTVMESQGNGTNTFLCCAAVMLQLHASETAYKQQRKVGHMPAAAWRKYHHVVCRYGGLCGVQSMTHH